MLRVASLPSASRGMLTDIVVGVFGILVCMGVFAAVPDDIRAEVPGIIIGTNAIGPNITDTPGSDLLILDTETGDSTVVGPMIAPFTDMEAFVFPSMAVDPTSRVIYAGGGGGRPEIYTVETLRADFRQPPFDDNLTLVGDTGLGAASIGALDFTSEGILYAAVNVAGGPNTGSDHLAVIDKATGAATLVGPFGACEGVEIPSQGGGECTIEGMEAIAFDADDDLWGARRGRGDRGEPGLYRIDRDTGAATFVAPIVDNSDNPPSGGVVSLQFACNGTLYGGTARALSGDDGGRLVTIDPSSGSFSFVGEGRATAGSSLGALAVICPIPSFLCYKTKDKRAISVSLSDQFESGQYRGKKAKWFCTAANSGEEAVSTDSNLKSWKVKGPHSKVKNVEVTNDFGSFFYDTKKTLSLMVPASIDLEKEPAPSLDHYRCLKVKRSKGTAAFPEGTMVPVDDAFGSRVVSVGKPTQLCLPTDKNGEGIKDPVTHLMCYKVTTSAPTRVDDVMTLTQFGEEVLDLKKEKELCLPSSKTPPGS